MTDELWEWEQYGVGEQRNKYKQIEIQWATCDCGRVSSGQSRAEVAVYMYLRRARLLQGILTLIGGGDNPSKSKFAILTTGIVLSDQG